MACLCYCSAGRGMGTFVSYELANLENVSQVNVTDGKVFFSCKEDFLYHLLTLKTVERSFICVSKSKTEDMMQGTYLDFNRLCSVIFKQCQWNDSIRHWKSLKLQSKGDNQYSTDTGGNTAEENKDSKQLSFRINCKCSGKVSRHWPSQKLSCLLGKRLSSLMGWKVDLRRPDIELRKEKVSVHLNDKDFVVGLPITREPLSKRNYIRHSGLRSTVAWTMSYLLNIQPGDIILDPMCGKGTILIEGSSNWKDAYFMGADISQSQVWLAAENIQHAKSTNICQLYSDVLALPVREESVDGVVCDLPFDQVHKVKDINSFYSQSLQEINRVLKPCGRIVLLTSCKLEKVILENIESISNTQRDYCKVTNQKTGQNSSITSDIVEPTRIIHPEKRKRSGETESCIVGNDMRCSNKYPRVVEANVDGPISLKDAQLCTKEPKCEIISDQITGKDVNSPDTVMVQTQGHPVNSPDTVMVQTQGRPVNSPDTVMVQTQGHPVNSPDTVMVQTQGRPVNSPDTVMVQTQGHPVNSPDTVMVQTQGRPVNSPDTVMVQTQGRPVNSPDTVMVQTQGHPVNSPDTVMVQTQGRPVNSPDTVMVQTQGRPVNSPDTVMVETQGRPVNSPDTVMAQTQGRPVNSPDKVFVRDETQDHPVNSMINTPDTKCGADECSSMELNCEGKDNKNNHSLINKKLPWIVQESFYIKLGETHAKICTFQKKK